MKSKFLVVSALALTVIAAASVAQQPAAPQPPAPITQQGAGIKRIPLQKFDVPGGVYETVIGIAEIAPNVAIADAHPGTESGYVVRARRRCWSMASPLAT